MLQSAVYRSCGGLRHGEKMTIPYQVFFERLCKATDIATQMDLATALQVNRSAITQAKLRDAVPQKWVLALARRYSLSPDWLEFGKGSPRLPGPNAPLQARADLGEDIVRVPKAAARLCAGGGSFEVDGRCVAEFPFPRQWLARFGVPSSMVFMDVVGDSMEPGIYDGDMVLVDKSHQRLSPGVVLAVGVDDAIYLKRAEARPGGVILRSDNPGYPPVELYGDELDAFRIIGKMVWLCRDYC